MKASIPPSANDTGAAPPRLAGDPARPARTGAACWLGWVGGAALLATLAVLFAFNPEHHGFYPPCVFHRLTGWDCPGCGGLRAMHHLLRGNVAAAFHFNPLVVLVLPTGLVLAGFHAWAKRRGWTPETRVIEGLLWLLLAALLVFAIWRNLVKSGGAGP